MESVTESGFLSFFTTRVLEIDELLRIMSVFIEKAAPKYTSLCVAAFLAVQIIIIVTRF